MEDAEAESDTDDYPDVVAAVLFLHVREDLNALAIVKTRPIVGVSEQSQTSVM